MKAILKKIPKLLELAGSCPGVRGKQHVAGLFTRRGVLVAAAVNQEKTHPIAADYRRGQWLHAEAAVLVDFLRTRGRDPQELKRMTLVSLRVNKTGQAVEACPCPDCRRLLESHDLGKVLYSNKQGELQTLW